MRSWAEIETDKLCQKVGCFDEPAITLAFLREHQRAVKIVKAEIKRVKLDQHTYTADTKHHVLDALNMVLANLERGRTTRRTT